MKRTPFVLVKDEDITPRVSPSIELVNDLLTNRIRPATLTIGRYVQGRYPLPRAAGDGVVAEKTGQGELQVFLRPPLQGSLRALQDVPPAAVPPALGSGRRPVQMDEIVSRSMLKWPDVPAVYGWLSLDRRGNWAIKTAGGRFERIANAAVREFIGRNYAADAEGRWYFQNGPAAGVRRARLHALGYTGWPTRGRGFSRTRGPCRARSRRCFSTTRARCFSRRTSVSACFSTEIFRPFSSASPTCAGPLARAAPGGRRARR